MFVGLVVSTALSSCQEEQTDTKNNLITISEKLSASEQGHQASTKDLGTEQSPFCINLWDELSLMNYAVTPAQVIKTVYFGKKMVMLGDTIIQEIAYTKVQLVQGDTSLVGWVNTQRIALHAELAVTTSESKIFESNDALSLSKESIGIGEVIAVYREKGAKFVRFETQKKAKTGYLSATEGFSTDAKEIEAGFLFQQIITKDLEARLTALEEFLENEQYQTSIFGELAQNLMESDIENSIIEKIDSVAEAMPLVDHAQAPEKVSRALDF